jgi:hypothetical protein
VIAFNKKYVYYSLAIEILNDISLIILHYQKDLSNDSEFNEVQGMIKSTYCTVTYTFYRFIAGCIFVMSSKNNR